MRNPPPIQIQHPDRIAEIRAIALSEILLPQGDFKVWHYFGELKNLRPRGEPPDWLEAMIMVCMIGRVRPSKTMANLNALRAKRTKADALPQFDAFKARLDSYLAPNRFTNHGYSSDTFETLDHGEIWSHVGTLIDELREAGFETFLNSGTLLGVVRDGKLIEHDDDIDLAIILPANSKKEAAEVWTSMITKFDEMGVIDPDGEKIKGIAKLRAAGNTEIDLFPAWSEDDQFFVYPHTFGELTRDDVLPTKTCPVTGYPIPANPEKMLALNYGEGWQKPDPYFKFPWGRAYQAFSEFLKRL